ncbi:MAG: DUF2905 family protein [Litorimonas sp.]
MGQILLWSLIASVVLTTLLNLILFAFPKTSDRIGQAVTDSLQPHNDDGRVRIVFPIKTMIIGSIVLTVLLNLGFVLFS